ncbi:cation-transporting P-type ATPase [Myxococcota bacterium]|nr:cation-transporting P-type ATPase [Myxococcota bacterium]
MTYGEAAATPSALAPGLGHDEAARILADVGPNALPPAQPTPLWLRFLRQFQNPLTYLLLFALAFDLGSWVFDGAPGWPVEALAIAAVLLLNASLGALQEHRSEQALRELEALAAPTAWVIRAGEVRRVPSRELVPGDLVRIEAGERVPADGDVVEAHGLMADESVLTGESMPLDKARGDEASSGTLIVRGKGALRITRTGPRSTMGKLASMLGRIDVEKTPLEKRLAALGKQLARWVGSLAAVLAVAGIIVEGPERIQEVILFTTALAIAAVPEGLPAVVTLALAMGVQRMAKRHAVVRRLSAVEALGSVTVIATDKTGTLTENHMAVEALEAEDADEAMRALVLANDADLGSRAGDPIDVALLDHGVARGHDIERIRREYPRRSVRPFDSAWKFMRVTVDRDGRPHSYVKGAPEVVLARCVLAPEQRAVWTARAEARAEEGYRVLALAGGDGEREEDLHLLGLVMSWDPPRAEVPEAMKQAQAAGVRVVMITGDHPGTARAVAERIGMNGTEVLTGRELDALDDVALREAVKRASVFARVSAEHKLRLVDALKANGEIVAMTGDGVNDAPALKRSDVGIAMGQRGSDVAREVADLVLLDDNFASIVGAIEEGRGIYANIQKFIRFLFSTNIALVGLVVIGVVGGLVVGLREISGAILQPLTAIQLLWINFMGDGPAALALALEKNPGVMQRPPRSPQSPLLDRPSLIFVWSTGLLKAIAGVALLVIMPVLGYAAVAVRTAVFLFESITEVVSAYPARHFGGPSTMNGVLHVVVLASVALQILTVALPELRTILGLVPLGGPALCAITAAIAATWLAAELLNRGVTRVYDHTRHG